MTVARRMGAVEWGFLLALTAAWSGIFLLTRFVLESVPPLTAVFLRLGLAAPLLIAAVYIQGDRLPGSLSAWTAFALMGFLNNAFPFTMFVWAQQSIASGLAAIVNATTPFFTVLLAHALTTDEKMTGGKVAGVLLGLVGVVVLIGPGAFAGLDRAVVAELVCLLAPISYAFAGLWGRRFRALSPTVAAAGMVTSSALMMAPLALWQDRPWTLAPSAFSLAAVAGQAAVGTALAYWLYFRILKTAGATNLLLVTFLMPPAAIALGAFFAGERFGWSTFAGLALIFVGLAAMDGRPAAYLRRRAIPVSAAAD
ncbi:MAG TPA: DMT family transporter [Stellaceae bacterium]|nr:DMT family transporter [Stellaceae bacterium]